VVTLKRVQQRMRSNRERVKGISQVKNGLFNKERRKKLRDSTFVVTLIGTMVLTA
jgi:hypothetical protein